ncbi:type II toxin-antitoxin system RelE/ParE family toxin [Chlorobium sp. N1]|uniref:type II toxin-antitoxin system RelE/ParE family toxin n=1 Tax=Chlorobium sp. N1 TaxID=2491138 RepID=UPI001039E4AD|nr:type II toxin-antitoxin system RelE/ParE family toxin [Chlorobium sp. N1]TCD47207.1 hypothetical protein E0L29_08940 [Chlorobium sp. N1]
MEIFKNKWFNKFAKHEGISDSALPEAIDAAERGLIDADYGGGVIKQRIARPDEGKSGDYRSVTVRNHSSDGNQTRGPLCL